MNDKKELPIADTRQGGCGCGCGAATQKEQKAQKPVTEEPAK